MKTHPLFFILLTLVSLAAAGLGLESAFTNSIGMKIVRIETGSFLTGQDGPAADYDVKLRATHLQQESLRLQLAWLQELPPALAP